jgi:hypothetical protein
MNDFTDAVVARWNLLKKEHPNRDITTAQWHNVIQSKVLFLLRSPSWSEDEILGAIDNLSKSLSLPNSLSAKFEPNLASFLGKLAYTTNYHPIEFDVKKFDADNMVKTTPLSYSEQEKKKQDDAYEALKND